MNNWMTCTYKQVLLIIVSSLLLTACAASRQTVEIRSDVDALATSEAQAKRRFVILPGNKDIKEQDLQFIEFKAYVEKTLNNRGFTKVDALHDGDVVLFLSYGVSEPQTYQYSYEVPTWNSAGFYPYYRRYWYYPMSPYYTQRMQTYLMYRRHLTLEAYDMAAYLQNKTPQQLWKVNVQSQGLSNDLRLTFPYMVVAMQPYIGSNTGHMVTVDVDEFNPLLKSLLNHQSNDMTAPVIPQ